MRISMGESAAPSVTAGSMRLNVPSLPDTGTQPSPMEKTMMSSGPSQKTGMLAPATARKPAPRSSAVPCLRAAAIPSGSEMSSATAIEASVSSAEAYVRLEDDGRDRALLVERIPQVPSQEPAHVFGVLNAYRPVQPKRLAQLFALGGAGGLAQHEVHRVARQHLGDDEDERRHPPQDGDEQQNAP